MALRFDRGFWIAVFSMNVQRRWMSGDALDGCWRDQVVFRFFSHLQDWRRRSLDPAGSCWRRLPGLGLHGDAGRGRCDSVDLTWASLTPANPSADRDHAAASSSTSTSWLMKTTGFVPIRTKSWDQEIVDQLDQPRALQCQMRSHRSMEARSTEQQFDVRLGGRRAFWACCSAPAAGRQAAPSPRVRAANM